MPVSIIGNSGIQFPDNSLQTAAASPFVLKNRIINGDMRIDQRNAGASVTPSSTGTTYTLDRWKIEVSSGSKISVQQNAGSVTPPTGFTKYLGITSLAATSLGATDYYILSQNIEGLNIADLEWGTANAQAVTLSFWVRSSLTGTFGGVLYNYTGAISYPFSYTISSANTWTKISITIAGPTTGTWLSDTGIGLSVVFGLGAGSSVSGTAGSWQSTLYRSATGATSVVGTNGATFYITGVQLEVGTSATPFERRLYGQELALCQRYYQRLTSLSGNYVGFGVGRNVTTTASDIYIKYANTMRSAPTIGLSNVKTDSTGTSPPTLGIAYYGSDSVLISLSGGSGLTAGQATTFIGNNNANAYVDFSAEL